MDRREFLTTSGAGVVAAAAGALDGPSSGSTALEAQTRRSAAGGAQAAAPADRLERQRLRRRRPHPHSAIWRQEHHRGHPNRGSAADEGDARGVCESARNCRTSTESRSAS